MANEFQFIFPFLGICWIITFGSSFATSDTSSMISEPQFVGAITNITTVVGSNVTLNCVVNSLGNYKVGWIHNDNLLTINDQVVTVSSRYKITHNNFRNWSLEILNVSKLDSGIYICIVNTYPKKYLRGTIHVVDTPIITISNQSIGGIIGCNISLECNVESNTSPVTYWKRDDDETLITSGTKYDTQMIDTDIFKLQMKLIIRNINPDDFGQYRCVANNSKGEMESAIRLYDISKAYSSTTSPISSLASSADETNGYDSVCRWTWITLTTFLFHLIFALY